LMKLWLALPAALLVTGSLCYSLWMGKKVGTTVLRWFLLALTTLAVGLLHLAWVAVIAPDDLGTWVHVYLKPVVERFADESDALSKPWWFYGAVIYRDFVFVGGLLVAYVVALRGGHTWTLFGRILGATAVFATLAMSLFGKKESLYLYPLVPIWCLCAAVGARWLFDVGKPGSDKRTGLRWMAGFWGVGMLTVGAVLAWLSFLGKSPSGALSTSFGAGHIVVCSILGVGLIVWSLVGTWPISTAVWVVIAAHLLWGGLMAGQRVADYRNNTSRALAQFFGAPQDAVPPGPETMTPRYVSAWSGIHGYWLWKKGRPWYYDDERDLSFEELQKRFGNEILFYEIDRSFKGTLGGPPTEQHHRMILGWLVSQTVEITEEIESHTGLGLSTRVFVPKK
ncbi:MAG: hypothetical protein HUU55_21515, partial [Myxococcales bacterium]|nr:hypothetical protein [Myxococcales bacterium]